MITKIKIAYFRLCAKYWRKRWTDEWHATGDAGVTMAEYVNPRMEPCRRKMTVYLCRARALEGK